jgi:hypothetical protein
MAGDFCVVCGYAKLPQATAAAQVYQMLTVAVLVDKKTDIVAKASVSLVTLVAREFVEQLLIGSNLLADQDKFLEELRINYAGGAQRAVRQAYRDVCERYLELRKAGGFSPEEAAVATGQSLRVPANE